MRVLLGVTGGIAAYKSAEIVREFVKRGDEVHTVMTEGAREFIQPLTLQVLSENPVGTEVFDPTYEDEIGHIELARWPDVVLVAPATANAIARMANGMGDDLLTTILLATQSPVVVAPAMNTQMWRHPLVQENVEKLHETPGYRVIDPDAGELACKEVGPGRMPDPPVLVEEVAAADAPQMLEGKRVVVTAGPTREHIDPVRLLTNPSSGKMGYAIARVARRYGAKVTLVSGPTELEEPMGVERIVVESAREMHAAVMARADEADFICKAAAVCDWRPSSRSRGKVSKDEMSSTLEMERNPDILAELGERFGPGGDEEGPVVIGFAAETDDVVERAREKLDRKGAHLLVANKVGGEDSTFGSETVDAHLLSASGTSIDVSPGTKEELAEHLWRRASEIKQAEE
jgi:phosphopantothenoylcysteine decarboxylase/phosphopantothenate--cysteine ligase